MAVGHKPESVTDALTAPCALVLSNRWSYFSNLSGLTTPLAPTVPDRHTFGALFAQSVAISVKGGP